MCQPEEVVSYCGPISRERSVRRGRFNGLVSCLSYLACCLSKVADAQDHSNQVIASRFPKPGFLQAAFQQLDKRGRFF